MIALPHTSPVWMCESRVSPDVTICCGNAAALFCCEAVEMFYWLRNFTQLFLSAWGWVEKWLHFHFWGGTFPLISFRSDFLNTLNNQPNCQNELTNHFGFNFYGFFVKVAVLRFRHRSHLVMVWKRFFIFWLKCLFWSPQTWLELSQGVLRNSVFRRHKHGCRCSGILSKISIFFAANSAGNCHEVSLKVSSNIVSKCCCTCQKYPVVLDCQMPKCRLALRPPSFSFSNVSMVHSL